MWTTVIIALIFLAIVVAVVSRGLQMRRLVEAGTVTEGTVRNKWRHHSSANQTQYRMRYAFTAKNGKIYSRAVLVSGSENNQYKEGDPVRVVYLLDNPRVSALSSMVESARAALIEKRQG